jgi:AraC family transcriptional regulator
METTAERFDTATATREKFKPGMVTLQDQGQWAGLRIEQWEGQSGELAETVRFQHGMAVNLGHPMESEVRWAGRRAASKSFMPGTFALFPAGIPYGAQSRGLWRGLILAIEPEFVESVLPRESGQRVELIPDIGVSDPFIWQATQVLARDLRERSPWGPGYGEAIATALAVHLVRRYAADDRFLKSHRGVGSPRQEQVKSFILDQLDQSLPLASLAAFAQMDMYSFAKWFKRSFGTSPHQYLLAARVRRAKELLESSHESLVQIALQCGFASHSHFTTTFRRFVGVSPRAYRNATASSFKQRLS